MADKNDPRSGGQGPGREPIELAEVRFAVPQNGPGMPGVPSAIKSRKFDPLARFYIEWWPWCRVIRVVALNSDGQPLKDGEFIVPEASAAGGGYWKFLK